jgi:hypothetical protein
MQNQRETAEQALKRWEDLERLQKHYSKFETLLVDVIEDVMGFDCSDVQIDIGDWIAYGPQYLMAQAQRGQAKTTIAAIYAVFTIIHNPATRVLIFSAGSGMATEIANWIIQIITNMPELECLRPDRSQGDRSSVSAYDIHYSLKGPEKSPSITCLGITANMQGKRADLLIADDIESAKNSQTALQRERILHLTLDFSSICAKGRIIWLGTPQSIDSLYNGLPGRGVSIRIWPGRFPTTEELPDYSGFLSPLLTQRILNDPSVQTGGGPTGTRGKPIDPILLDEETLTKKEIDQGASYFQLQHMLSTKLSDKDRYPLKLSQIRFIGFDREEKRGPMTLGFIRGESSEVKLPEGHLIREKMYRVQEVNDFAGLMGYHMYVDPSGGGKNGDELAYAVTGFLAGRVFLVDVNGRPGGLDDAATDWLTAAAVRWKPKQIDIEQNYGNGALASVWKPKLLKHYQCGIEDVWETGQKELRIIDVLEPIIGAGKFVVSEELIHEDWERCSQYPLQSKGVFSLFWQLARITRDKGSLIHDDRLDAVAGSTRHWAEHVAADSLKAVAAAKQSEYRNLMNNPLGNGRPLNHPFFKGSHLPNALARHNLSGLNPLRR